MEHHQQHAGSQEPAHFGRRGLELPRLAFSTDAAFGSPRTPSTAPRLRPAQAAPASPPRTSAFTPPAPIAPRPYAPSHAAPHRHVHAHAQAHARVAPVPPSAPAPRIAFAPVADVHVPTQPHHATPVPVQHAAPRAAAPTPPSVMNTIPWERLESDEPDRTLLQRITPAHMGVAMIAVVALMIMSAAPAAMKTDIPVALPAVRGGGEVIMPVQPIPRTTTTTGATDAAADAKAVPARELVGNASASTPKAFMVGDVSLPATAQHGGIISPAAAANLTTSGGGGAPADDALQLDGIPTAAASEQLGGKVSGGGGTPVDDGVTLPRSSGERDTAATEQHYGVDGGGSNGVDEPLASQPVMTPGEAARIAEERSATPSAVDSTTYASDMQ